MGEKGEQNSHENSTSAMAVFPVMLADPYIISDVPRVSPHIYCLCCGFTSVRVSRHRHEGAMQLSQILLSFLRVADLMEKKKKKKTFLRLT